MIRASRLGQLALGLLVVCAGSARVQAIDLLINVQQVGSDVVATASGFVNTAALTNGGSASTSGGRFFGSIGGGSMIQVAGTNYDLWGGITGYTGKFGTSSTQYFATSSSGTTIGIATFGNSIYLGQGYTSGSAISATSTYQNQTLTSLGMTVGTYNWTWGSGATAGSAQLVINAVPEPSTYALGAIATGVMAAIARRRKRLQAQTA